MHQASPINRTNHPKWVTYNGDGRGRDHYIIFDNGGLNKLSDYQGSKVNTFHLGPHPFNKGVTPSKEPSVIDYVPDGSGRDLYIIQQFGLKKNYKSNNSNFERTLRTGHSTPQMDFKIAMNRNSLKPDASLLYNNWPSESARRLRKKTAVILRQSIERLSQKPSRVSPMFQYLSGTATHQIDPKEKVQSLKRSFILRTEESVESQRSLSVETSSPSTLRKLNLQAKDVKTDLTKFSSSLRNNQISQKRNSTAQVMFTKRSHFIQPSGDSLRQIPEIRNEAQEKMYLSKNAERRMTLDTDRAKRIPINSPFNTISAKMISQSQYELSKREKKSTVSQKVVIPLSGRQNLRQNIYTRAEK